MLSADISLSDVSRKPNEGLVSGSKRLVDSIVLDVSRRIGKVLVAELDEVENIQVLPDAAVLVTNSRFQDKISDHVEVLA